MFPRKRERVRVGLLRPPPELKFLLVPSPVDSIQHRSFSLMGSQVQGYGAGSAVYCNTNNRTLAQTQALGYMTDGISSDPQFVDAAAGNFTLKPTSPTRGTGMALSPPLDTVLTASTVFHGLWSPQGPKASMGAFSAPR